MNWLFNFILRNNFFKQFVPKQDIDKDLVEKDGLKDEESTRDYYEDLSNMH
ncbi:MAG: hypothetical protein LN588_04625 [Rickettsia endosymbiont of Bryobia graminum]|nr:hypothetical protein [Rickettsia endosymbiont of Bryobia graminum]